MSEMSKLPVLSGVNTVGIPSKKLNTVEQKTYREYANSVCEKISHMLRAIQEQVIEKLGRENREKVVADVIKNTPVITKFYKDVSELLGEAEAINKESFMIISDYEEKKAKLTADMETQIANLKSSRMLPTVNRLNNLKTKVWEYTVENKNAINNPLKNANFNTTTAKEYSYDYDNDDFPGTRTRNIEIAYPAIRTTDIVGMKERSFVNSDIVDIKLEELMEPVLTEFKIAEIKLERMEQAVKEVMLLDETKMNEAFTKLLEFRDSIQKQHMQVIRNINIEEIE